ncbi:MAG: branched-chain amino acid ABC transporter permease [Chloroflexota bacterium]
MVKKSPKTIRAPRREQLLSYSPYIVVGLISLVLPPFTDPYLKSMMAKILIFAIFALSLNLIFGYVGLFSLGHAAFLGVSSYTAAILIVRYGITNFWLVSPIAILTAVLFAAIFGVIALRASGIYFLLVTLAMGQLLYSITLKWRTMTGGSDGIAGIPYPDLGIPGLTMNATSFYYLVLAVFIICFLLMRRVVNSPFGQALQGIREDERRMRHLGYHTWLYKYIAFIIAGLFAGVAGVLFGSYTTIIVPDYLGVLTSTLVMLMVIIGGTGVFWGPALGAAVVVLLEHYASLYTPERWPLILGGVFILAVMLLRGGISIHLLNLWKKVRYSYGSGKD